MPFFYQNFSHYVLHSFHIGDMVGVIFLNFFDDKPGKKFGGLQIASTDGYAALTMASWIFRTKINYLPFLLIIFAIID